MPTVAPYGSWKSPISSQDVARAGRWRFSQLTYESGAVYWVESRPGEAGRNVVVRREAHGDLVDVTPPGFNARTRVHEYGGGAYFVHGSTIFFSNYEDQRLYRQEGPGATPRPITPEPKQRGALRYADGRVTRDGQLIVCVRELHGDGEPANEIVALLTDGSSEPVVVVSGSDFYSSPRISPDGRKLAWISWNHPRMPWEGAELWVAAFGEDGRTSEVRRVAGGPEESVLQPEWDPQGVLHFVSDRSGWWNLYRRTAGGCEPLAPMRAEVGRPQWVFGQSSYAFLEDGRLVFTYGRGGEDHLAVLAEGTAKDVAVPYTAISYLCGQENRALFVGASPTAPPRVVSCDVDRGHLQEVSAPEQAPDAAYVSRARHIDFPSHQELTAHAFFYEPANPGFQAPPGERPPLLVTVHGGPTSHVTSELKLSIQFWTTRGFAVVDVNYGGSSGYGRAYRQRLNGRWGIVDALDCINAARHLAERGEVDPQRMAITGGSAGGWTALCALTFHDVFAAGASHFGVSDLAALARETHKFESRYLDSLVGPLPEARQLYYERSPINFTDRLSRPLIVFQGLEDEIVPPSQSERIVEALRKAGVPHAYLAFEGEQHGFRRAENIKRALEAELYFYSRIFGFEPADDIEPVEIRNL